MAEYIWCHGPNCHTYHTVDRVRGSKGSKVLRTKKVRQHGGTSFYNWFCSMGCYNDFANKHADAMRRIAPRPTPLETRIEDPVREKHTHNYSFGEHSWYSTTIKEVDEESNVG
jgi:hypothetical protein